MQACYAAAQTIPRGMALHVSNTHRLALSLVGYTSRFHILYSMTCNNALAQFALDAFPNQLDSSDSVCRT